LRFVENGAGERKAVTPDNEKPVRRIVAMHQPNYLPWIGFFAKISLADCVLFMDTFQFSRSSVTHRNRVRVNTGSIFLTIPIAKQFSLVKIKDVKLPDDQRWREIHWQTILRNYKKTPYFKSYSPFFEDLYHRDFIYLSELNLEMLGFLLKCFEINAEILLASRLNLDPDLKATDAIIAAMKTIGGETYLSGPSGKGYLESEKFPDNGLGLAFSKFSHPVYPQRYSGFEPNMAAVDLLFNVGPRAAQMIKACATSETCSNTVNLIDS
jgi:hypothetical protein